jgi:hypothetical protein
VVQPLSYDVSLLIWLMALWSYCPSSVPDHTIQLEADYEAFAARTKNMLGNMKSYIGRVR